MILILTSLMYKLGQQAAVAHVHTRLCTYTHGFNATAGSEGKDRTSEAD